MATVLLLTLGSRGDVQPYVALGAVLAERGHDVTVSTGQGFDDLITKHGLSSAPLSIDMQAMLARPEITAAMGSLKGRLHALRSTQELMQRQLDDMWSVARQVAPHVIVYHPKAFLAPYFARALGVMAVPSYLQPAFAATGSFPSPLLRLPSLGPLGNRLSGQAMIAMMRLGYRTMLRKWFPRHPEVSARPGLDVVRGYHPKGRLIPRLYAHSGHIVPKPMDWGADDHVTGYWFLTRASSWEPPSALADFLASGPPPVYVGFGSMPAVDAERTASVVVGALRQTRTRAILATGWGALCGAVSAEDLYVVESTPHDWLFPRCGAVVHHGGAGTTHEGLRWGRPTLVCPVFGDQPFWGRTVEEMGAGPVPIPLRSLNEDRFSAALRHLQAKSVQQGALSLSGRIQREGGAEAAADLIEAASHPM